MVALGRSTRCIVGLALMAVTATALVILASRRTQAGSNRENTEDPESPRFLRQVSMASAALALLAMLWATVPLLASTCGLAAA